MLLAKGSQQKSLKSATSNHSSADNSHPVQSQPQPLITIRVSNPYSSCTPSSSSIPTASQYFPLYQLYFKQYKSSHSTLYHNNNNSNDINHINNNNNNIRKSDTFVTNLDIKIIRDRNQSCEIQIKWGYYAMRITVIKITMPGSSLHGDKIAGSGAYSLTYHTCYRKRNYIIKSITHNCNQSHYHNHHNSSKSLNPNPNINPIININSPQIIAILSQYFLTSISSLYQLAPKVHRLYGYDIVFFDDCADFVIQLCHKIQYQYQEYSFGVIQAKMKENLYFLHKQLKICHRDIKPSNIMWSNQYRKPVFIDFGLAKIISQPIGFKSVSNFAGTYLFCGNQMKQCYKTRIPLKIDLFYNDIQCLHNTFSNQRQRILQNQHQNNNNNNQQNTDEQQQNQVIRQIKRDLKNGNIFGFNREANRMQILVGFFNIMFLLFNGQIQRVFNLMEEEKIMVNTVNKIFIYYFCYPFIAKLEQQQCKYRKIKKQQQQQQKVQQKYDGSQQNVHINIQQLKQVDVQQSYSYYEKWINKLHEMKQKINRKSTKFNKLDQIFVNYLTRIQQRSQILSLPILQIAHINQSLYSQKQLTKQFKSNSNSNSKQQLQTNQMQQQQQSIIIIKYNRQSFNTIAHILKCYTTGIINNYYYVQDNEYDNNNNYNIYCNNNNQYYDQMLMMFLNYVEQCVKQSIKQNININNNNNNNNNNKQNDSIYLDKAVRNKMNIVNININMGRNGNINNNYIRSNNIKMVHYNNNDNNITNTHNNNNISQHSLPYRTNRFLTQILLSSQTLHNIKIQQLLELRNILIAIDNYVMCNKLEQFILERVWNQQKLLYQQQIKTNNNIEGRINNKKYTNNNANGNDNKSLQQIKKQCTQYHYFYWILCAYFYVSRIKWITSYFCKPKIKNNTRVQSQKHQQLQCKNIIQMIDQLCNIDINQVKYNNNTINNNDNDNNSNSNSNSNNTVDYIKSQCNQIFKILYKIGMKVGIQLYNPHHHIINDNNINGNNNSNNNVYKYVGVQCWRQLLIQINKFIILIQQFTNNIKRGQKCNDKDNVNTEHTNNNNNNITTVLSILYYKYTQHCIKQQYKYHRYRLMFNGGYYCLFQQLTYTQQCTKLVQEFVSTFEQQYHMQYKYSNNTKLNRDNIYTGNKNSNNNIVCSMLQRFITSPAIINIHAKILLFQHYIKIYNISKYDSTLQQQNDNNNNNNSNDELQLQIQCTLNTILSGMNALQTYPHQHANYNQFPSLSLSLITRINSTQTQQKQVKKLTLMIQKISTILNNIQQIYMKLQVKVCPFTIITIENMLFYFNQYLQSLGSNNDNNTSVSLSVFEGIIKKYVQNCTVIIDNNNKTNKMNNNSYNYNIIQQNYIFLLRQCKHIYRTLNCKTLELKSLILQLVTIYITNKSLSQLMLIMPQIIPISLIIYYQLKNNIGNNVENNNNNIQNISNVELPYKILNIMFQLEKQMKIQEKNVIQYQLIGLEFIYNQAMLIMVHNISQHQLVQQLSIYYKDTSNINIINKQQRYRSFPPRITLQQIHKYPFLTIHIINLYIFSIQISKQQPPPLQKQKIPILLQNRQHLNILGFYGTSLMNCQFLKRKYLKFLTNDYREIQNYSNIKKMNNFRKNIKIIKRQVRICVKQAMKRYVKLMNQRVSLIKINNRQLKEIIHNKILRKIVKFKNIMKQQLLQNNQQNNMKTPLIKQILHQ